jgi:hypothetical protein
MRCHFAGNAHPGDSTNPEEITQLPFASTGKHQNSRFSQSCDRRLAFYTIDKKFMPVNQTALKFSLGLGVLPFAVFTG